MHLNDVLFIGGAERLPSVRIRCVDIARHIGCDYLTGIERSDQVPVGYKAFFCVKTRLPIGEIYSLAERGHIIWDVVDHVPPDPNPIGWLVTSTQAAKNAFDAKVPIHVIPQYHCNIEGMITPPPNLRAGWIGHPHWRPEIPGLECDFYDVTGMNRNQVVEIHRKFGIGINFRNDTERAKKHAALNSGIKLVNCIGFGLPSVSSDEPAYRELGADCTLICRPYDCAEKVRELISDPSLYESLRRVCLRRAEDYHISKIANCYRRLIKEL